MISTRLTRLFGIRHPVIQAGMGGVARADLVAAVSNAGGMGTLGMIRSAPQFIREQIHKTRALTSLPFGVNLVPHTPGPSGFDAQLAVCIEERVTTITLFWCDPAPWVNRCHDAGIKVMFQAGGVEEAKHAVASGVDVIIAQGVEAGGHVRGTLGLLPLVAAIVDAVPVPVVASGGIVDGRGLAAALALGAEGVALGTRFIASDESEAHPDYKRRLVEAHENDTIHTEMFHLGWPPRSPHRVLRNALTEGATPPATIGHIMIGGERVEIPPFAAPAPTIHAVGRLDLMANYAGQGAGLIREILPAALIVEQVVAEAQAAIERLANEHTTRRDQETTRA